MTAQPTINQHAAIVEVAPGPGNDRNFVIACTRMVDPDRYVTSHTIKRNGTDVTASATVLSQDAQGRPLAYGVKVATAPNLGVLSYRFTADDQHDEWGEIAEVRGVDLSA